MNLPLKIKHIPKPPSRLYSTGTYPLELIDSTPSIAIVGSRRPDAYGIHATRHFAQHLTARGLVIISGLARGVDTIAHTTCIESGGTTIAVIPTDVDTIYPRTHWQLADKIRQKGCIVSEHANKRQPMKHDFLIRNRLISGLSDAVLVTSALARSGSLNTAYHALEQGKTVMAVPGPINQALSEGPNNLIKAGALPITTVDDVLIALNLPVTTNQRSLEQIAEDAIELRILRSIQDGNTSAEAILNTAKLDAQTLSQYVTILELRQVIAPTGIQSWSLAI